MASLNVTIGIILYRNDLDLLYKTFLGIREQVRSTTEFEIQLVIIDNDHGKQVAEVTSLAKKAAIELLLIEASENIGFGAGHNYLFNRVQKLGPAIDYYICMNPDGVPHRSMVDILLQFAIDRGNQGIFEAKQFPVEHPKIYDMQNFTTPWCSGCCLLFPTNVYIELGGFDDIFFLYCEDVDVSWRTQLLGYKCYTVPGAFFYHYVFGKDRNLSRQEIEMTISSYKLAVKYGHLDNARGELDRLKGLISSERFTTIINSSIVPTVIEGIIPNYIDFNHGRYFAPARW